MMRVWLTFFKSSVNSSGGSLSSLKIFRRFRHFRDKKFQSFVALSKHSFATFLFNAGPFFFWIESSKLNELSLNNRK